MLFAAFVAMFVLAAVTTYGGVERHYRSQWIRYEHVDVDETTGVVPFRRDDGPATYLAPVPESRAPFQVRAVGLWSIAMGQMAIPGGLLAAFGTLFFGMGLLGIPGVILAARIWRDGIRLLEADPRVVDSAKKTADFAFILNACVVGLTMTLVIVDGGTEMLPLALLTLLYAGVSFAHAAMLRIAADDVRIHLEHRRHTTRWKPAVPKHRAA